MKTCLPFASLALLLLASAAQATPICRWVDAAGHGHIAAVVPEAYNAVATCVDSLDYELSPEQGQAAAQRAAQRRADARRAAVRPPTLQGSAEQSAAGARPPPTVKRPTEVVTEATDCSSWWRIYDESAACFAPFVTTRGAVKVEAFDLCNEVASPEPRCGPRSR